MSIKIGSIDYIPFVANKEIDKVYFGNTLIYQKNSGEYRDYILHVKRCEPRAVFSGNTTYNDQSFIAFTVTAGTRDVTVTYDGVTQIVPAGTSQNVVYGLYKNIDDGTAQSGNIVFSGDYVNVRPASISSSKNTASVPNVIESIVQYFGEQMTDTTGIMYNQSITSFEFPSFMTSIGENAFRNCKQLVWSNELIIPTTIQSIGSYAFYENSASVPTKVCFSSSVESIGSNAFDFSPSASSHPQIDYYYDGSVQDWLNISFASRTSTIRWNNASGQLYFLDANGNINFNNKTYSLLTNVVIPNTYTEIKPYAFYDLIQLVSVTLSSSLNSIGDGAFWFNYTNLCEIYAGSLPNLETIGERAFMGCHNLDIGSMSNLKTIGLMAFYACKIMNTLVISSTVTTVGNSAFSNAFGQGVTKVYFEHPNISTLTLSGTNNFIFASGITPEYYFKDSQANVEAWQYWTTQNFSNTTYHNY